MTALEKPTRRKIFYLMALLFLIFAPLVILYSKGYVIDFSNRGLAATGGVFIKTVQTGTKVLIDSDFSKETSLIAHGLLVTNLEPKRYALRVEKEGFRPWQKVVRVSSQEVLEFRDVFLPPEKIIPEAVFNAGKKAPARVRNLDGRPELALEVGDPAKPFNVFIVNPETKLSRLNLIKVSRWFWDENSGVLVIGRESGGRTQWFRIPRLDGVNLKEELFAFRGLPAGFSAESVWPHPANPGEFYFFAGGALFLQGRSSVPIPIAEQTHAYRVGRERIYLISKNGFFSESDLAGGDVKIRGRKGLFLDEERPAKIFVSPAGDAAVLDSSGGLFVYRPGLDEELKLVSGNVVGVGFSASGDRLLYWDDHRLWFYWLKDNRKQPFDIADTKKQIFYSDGSIAQPFLNDDGSYVFFSTPEGIYMVETDNRGDTNSYDLIGEPVSSFAFDGKKLALYWVKGSTLYRARLK